MKLKLFIGLSFWLLILSLSCQDDDFSFDDSTAPLRFSKDTLVLDTVYSQVRSETYLVKVYNTENKDVKIPKIELEKGDASLYKINVDGRTGSSFINIPIRKKDSLYIFVEVAPVANTSEFIAEDNIIFNNGRNIQKVNLRSVVQDAEFFIQSGTNPNILNDNTIWTNQKAKIIQGNLTLAEGKTLTIEEGTKVYFTKNSSLKISKNAKLNILGNKDKEVIFRGERNDARYDTIPLNWNGIALENGAEADINHTKIFGGNTALTLNHAKAKVKNTTIHTFQEYGILGINANVEAQNLVMNNFGSSAIHILKGGNYNINKSTLVNYRNFNTFNDSPILSATNEWTNENNQKQNADFLLNIKNSIVYTEKDNAIVMKPITGQSFSYNIQNSLVKFGNNSGYQWDNNPLIINSIKNEDPLFIHYFIAKMNLRLKDNSPIKGKGIGAYE